MNRVVRNGSLGPNAARGQRGVTLVELIATLVIVGVIVGGLLIGFRETLRHSGYSKRMSEALQLAQERTELIRARKDAQGFTAFVPVNSDPCGAAVPSPHPACNARVIAGKTVTTTIDLNAATSYRVAATIEDDPGLIPAPFNDGNYKTIRVVVSGAGAQLAELNTLVSNH